MIIKSLHVENFRSIVNETLHCEDLTALVGANGAGKSALLRASDLFYNPTPKLDADDFYNGETGKEIVVTVTFTALNNEAKALFGNYMQGDDLTVERVFTWEGGKASWKYHGASLQNPLFLPVRDGFAIKDRGKTAREAYERVKAMGGYESLPAWLNLGDAAENLKNGRLSIHTNAKGKETMGSSSGSRKWHKGILESLHGSCSYQQ